jgi:hypothetical protein
MSSSRFSALARLWYNHSGKELLAMLPPAELLLRDFPDHAIRRQLEHPANLHDLLTAVVPTLAPGLACEQAELLHRELPLPDWRHRELDLLFRIPYRTAAAVRALLVCVLIEHQSAPDPRMALRLLLYTALYWERQWKAWEDHPAPKPTFALTPVLPIVFHTGPTVWGSHRRLADLLGEPEAFHAFAPRYEPVFWSLAERAPEALLQATGAWLQTLAVVRAEQEEPDVFWPVVDRCLEQLRELSARDPKRWLELVNFIVAWVQQRRSRRERDRLAAAIQGLQVDVAQQKEVQIMSETIAEWLMTEGQLRESRTNLRAVLERRFGTVPEALAQRIETSTELERLRAALLQAIHMDRLDELQL